MPPFRALCFSTRPLIEMTKAITMTLLAKRPSLDLRLAPVKDVQQAVSATLEFKMVPTSISETISPAQVGRHTFSDSFKCPELRRLFSLFYSKSHKPPVLAATAHTNGIWDGYQDVISQNK